VAFIKTLPAILACCALQTLLIAQTETPPAPKANAPFAAATPGPTLEETTKFIVDQTLSQSPIYHRYQVHFTFQPDMSFATEETWNSFSFSGCRSVSERASAWEGGSLKSNQSVELGSIDPNSITVRDYAQILHINDLAIREQVHDNLSVHLTDVYSANPPVYVIAVKQSSPLVVEGVQKQVPLEVPLFLSADKALAERVARAYIHAIVLCGGGKNQPF
jgi:hypothetical protein